MKNKDYPLCCRSYQDVSADSHKLDLHNMISNEVAFEIISAIIFAGHLAVLFSFKVYTCLNVLDWFL